MKSVTVKAPATTANLGSGFDCVGMALGVFNEVTVCRSSSPIVDIQGEGSGELPTGETNLVYRSIQRLYNYLGIAGIELEVHCLNRIPLARGLGSSAAAIVAGLCAANLLLEPSVRASMDQLLEIAVSIEGHPDNVAPALYGGVVVSATDGKATHYVRMEAPEGIVAVVAIPDFHLSTEKARAVLPSTVPHRDAVLNVGRCGLLVAALAMRRYDLLEVAMRDRLHQPYRASLVPGLDAVMEAAYGAGALGAAMSGAGPSMIALCRPDRVEPVSAAMQSAFRAHGVTSSIVVTEPSAAGVTWS